MRLSKICSKCKQKKSLEEFHAQSGNKDGLQYICKNCSRQACGQRYKKKSRDVLDYNKEWIAAHPEVYKEKVKKYNSSPTGKISLRINRALDRIFGKERPTFSEILGCGPSCLAVYLTVRLKEGQSWENYGQNWVTGFILPPKDKSEYLSACHYKNLKIISKNDLRVSDLELQ